MSSFPPHSEDEPLRSERDRLRAALDHVRRVAQLGQWSWDLRTQSMHSWSPELVELCGADLSGAVDPDAPFELIHPADRDRVRAVVTAAMESGATSFQHECRLVGLPEERVVRTMGEIHRSPEGVPLLLTAIVQDLTELQRSQEAQARSEAMQAAVVEAAFDCVIVIDQDGLVVDWNLAAERTFGWPREEVLGLELAGLIIPPEFQERHRRALAAHGTGESQILGRRVELSALRRDGTEFPVELAITTVELPGRPPLFAGYLRDITERKQAEEARRAAESRWRALVEQIPAVTYLSRFDEQASIIYISPQVQNLYGTPPELWIDDPTFWLTRVHPDDMERVILESQARFAEKRGFSCIYRVRGADDSWIWVEEQSTILHGEDGEPRYLQGVVMDVTERRAHEEELREAQRLESVGQLAGGVAHDFNNLLGIIQGYAELVEPDVPETSRSDIREIRRAAERAAELTRQLLLFARREPAEPKVLDVNDVVDDLSDVLRRTVGEHVAFDVSLAAGRCLVSIPPGQLEQILVNLTVNARDAMPGGGSLEIVTRVRGDRVRLRVRDTGSGMTDAVASRAFDPFFTTKEKGRGTGLGLATVYGIVQGAGGRVQLDTAPAEGTAVTIELPLSSDVPEPEVARASGPLEGHGETVLVVEDQSAVRGMTARMLEENGYRVIDAPDGYRARILCDQYQGEIHLLLSDVVMPGMSGREVAEQLRTLRPALKVLYMSGHAGDVLDHHGFPGQDTRLLEKPFDRDRLLSSVRAALGASS